MTLRWKVSLTYEILLRWREREVSFVEVRSILLVRSDQIFLNVCHVAASIVTGGLRGAERSREWQFNAVHKKSLTPE